MPGKGGKTSGSWKKGQNPKMAKGAKHKRTRLKESIGLRNWTQLKSFIENEGATKLVGEMQKLNGKEFITAYSSLAEFVKPKLQRTQVVGDPNQPLIVSNINYEALPTEVLQAIVKARVKANG